MKIGVISDTHDYLDPRVVEDLEGVDHILHGGDVGLPWLLLDLRAIAPVTAVLGNTDDPALGYRETEIVELAGRKFMVHHIVNPRSPDDKLKARIAKERPDVVVFGHTHKPFNETIGRILYFNPGSAGKARFGLPRTLAILDCSKDKIKPQFINLD